MSCHEIFVSLLNKLVCVRWVAGNSWRHYMKRLVTNACFHGNVPPPPNLIHKGGGPVYGLFCLRLIKQATQGVFTFCQKNTL
jgi:hypothetical protein